MHSDRLESLLENSRGRPDRLIEVLLDVQDSEGHISEHAMRRIAQVLGVPLMNVYSAATFYKAFSLTPRGKHTCTVCMGTACHVRGAPLLLHELEGQLGVLPGMTTPDGLFTVERVNCVGACAMGPVVILDGAYRHHMTPAALRKVIRQLRKAEGQAEVKTNA